MNITFKVDKDKPTISIEMSVDEQVAGVFQYDTESGITLHNLNPSFHDLGLGRILILKGIHTATILGSNYIVDEALAQSSTFDNALHRLVELEYIVNNTTHWHVTPEGEKYLDQFKTV
jgi:hypothetical protein